MFLRCWFALSPGLFLSVWWYSCLSLRCCLVVRWGGQLFWRLCILVVHIMQFDILKPLFFFQCFGFPPACERVYLEFFAGSCHRPAFFVVCWFVVLVVGSWYFHVSSFFSTYVESVALFIKYVSPELFIFIGGIRMIPHFVDGRLLCRFLFPLAALSLEHCFARPFRSPAQAELWNTKWNRRTERNV